MVKKKKTTLKRIEKRINVGIGEGKKRRRRRGGEESPVRWAADDDDGGDVGLQPQQQFRISIRLNHFPVAGSFLNH